MHTPLNQLYCSQEKNFYKILLLLGTIISKLVNLLRRYFNELKKIIVVCIVLIVRIIY